LEEQDEVEEAQKLSQNSKWPINPRFSTFTKLFQNLAEEHKIELASHIQTMEISSKLTETIAVSKAGEKESLI